MDGLGKYLISVSAGVILVVLSQAMVNKKGLNRVLQMVGGLFLVIIIAAPVVQVDPKEISSAMSQWVETWETAEWKDRNVFEEQLASRIIQNCEEYILDKAAELGMEMEITVELDGSALYPVPSKVVLRGSCTLQQKSELERIIAEDLGVPVSCQEWIEM